MAKSEFNFRFLDFEEYKKLDQIVNLQKNVYNSEEWLSNLLGNNVKVVGLFDGGNNLIGGMAVRIYLDYGFKILRGVPLTQHSGPIFKSRAEAGISKIEEQDRVLKALLKFINIEVKPAICLLPLDPEFKTALPFQWNGFKVSPCISYLINLNNSEENLWNHLSSKCRRNIRAAIRDELDTKLTDEPEIIIDLTAKTFQRQKANIDLNLVTKIVRDFANENNSFCYTTYRRGLPISMCFCIHDSQTAYYILGGYDNDNAHHGAGPAAFWSAILHAKRMGLKVFDFEGSMVPPIENYFRQFGGERSIYLTISKAWFPLECILKLFKRNSF